MKSLIDTEAICANVEAQIIANNKGKLDKYRSSIKEWATANEVKEIERIPVPTSYREIEIIKGKKGERNSKGKWLYADEVESYKEPFVEEQDIIKALKAAYPESIENSIYYFPTGTYYFITDKNKAFNLKCKPRPFTSDEQDIIEEYRKEIEETEKELEETLSVAKVLSAAYKPDPTEEEIELAKQNTLIVAKYDYEQAKEFCYDFKTERKKWQDRKKEITQRLKEFKKRTEDEPIFTIHPLKLEKQVRIYISSYYTDKVNELGYKVIEQKRTRTVKKFQTDKALFEEEEEENTTYSIRMCVKAFIGCCKSGFICQKGYYTNESGERCFIEHTGTRKEVSLTDWNGVTRTFNSLTDAAKFFNLDIAHISRVVKNGGVINKPKNKIKEFCLLNPQTNQYYKFNSMTDAADILNCNKMVISRALKDKSFEDEVTIKKITYILKEA